MSLSTKTKAAQPANTETKKYSQVKRKKKHQNPKSNASINAHARRKSKQMGFHSSLYLLHLEVPI